MESYTSRTRPKLVVLAGHVKELVEQRFASHASDEGDSAVTFNESFCQHYGLPFSPSNRCATLGHKLVRHGSRSCAERSYLFCILHSSWCMSVAVIAASGA